MSSVYTTLHQIVQLIPRKSAIPNGQKSPFQIAIAIAIGIDVVLVVGHRFLPDLISSSAQPTRRPTRRRRSRGGRRPISRVPVPVLFDPDSDFDSDAPITFEHDCCYSLSRMLKSERHLNYKYVNLGLPIFTYLC